MVLRGAFWQVGIGLAHRHSAAIGAGKLMKDQLFGVQPWDPVHAGGRGTAARPGGAGGLADSRVARGRRRADGGAAERVIDNIIAASSAENRKV